MRNSQSLVISLGFQCVPAFSPNSALYFQISTIPCSCSYNITVSFRVPSPPSSKILCVGTCEWARAKRKIGGRKCDTTLYTRGRSAYRNADSGEKDATEVVEVFISWRQRLGKKDASLRAALGLVTGSVFLSLVYIPCTLSVPIVAHVGCMCRLPAERLSSCLITTWCNGADICQCLMLNLWLKCYREGNVPTIKCAASYVCEVQNQSLIFSCEHFTSQCFDQS